MCTSAPRIPPNHPRSGSLQAVTGLERIPQGSLQDNSFDLMRMKPPSSPGYQEVTFRFRFWFSKLKLVEIAKSFPTPLPIRWVQLIQQLIHPSLRILLGSFGIAGNDRRGVIFGTKCISTWFIEHNMRHTHTFTHSHTRQMVGGGGGRGENMEEEGQEEEEEEETSVHPYRSNLIERFCFFWGDFYWLIYLFMILFFCLFVCF